MSDVNNVGGGLSVGSYSALSLGTNITAQAGFWTPAAALIGPSLLKLRGCILTTGVIGAGATIFTLPSASMFPAQQLRFVTADNTTQDGVECTISTSGVCTVINGYANGASIGYDHILLSIA